MEADSTTQAVEPLLDPGHGTESENIGDSWGENNVSASSFQRTKHLLYVSHFLSTWNSRAFEFGAFLFLAVIYPQTLLPASVYALTRAAAAVVLAPWVGIYVDRGERLQVIRVSIVGQRVAVAVSCTVLFFMSNFEALRTSKTWSGILLFLLCFLSGVEKVSAVLNTISVERDWVVVIAEDDESRLRTLNSQMRRIDLFCKLVAPLAVSLVDTFSSQAAILATGGLTCLSVGVEYLAIARVYRMVSALQTPKVTTDHHPTASVLTRFRQTCSGTITYVQHRAFLPSFALALLYLTVLSFSGQMITYLLALGMSSGSVGALRGVAALFELSATWLGPRLMSYVGPVRAGIWFLNWEFLCVLLAALFFWLAEDTLLCTYGTVAAVIASRVGLWGFDLSAQIIVQDEVEPELRGTFSSQEFALQNLFEMLAFASTVVFARPSDFKIPATISAAAVGLASISYAAFVRVRRGHLFHLSSCIDPEDKDHEHRGWLRVTHEER